ncbi:uncharacterized protein [Amphiura filiformis]|uniref:uncharacterized protein isoform X2 n=1 Tax=Amphiura filiformis TaxID=82378 RepID=UPI003B21E287
MVFNMAVIRNRKRRLCFYVLISTSLVLFFVWQHLGDTLTHRRLIDLETNLIGYETIQNGRDGSRRNKSVVPANGSGVTTSARINITKVPTDVNNKVPLQSGPCDDECQWLKLQQSRKDRVLDSCDASFDRGVEFGSVQWSDKKFKNKFNHILVSDQYQLLYCYVPKVGCTNWKRIFLTLNGEVAASEVIPQKKVHYMPIPKLSDFTFEEAKERLKMYTKFLFVRNPHERMLSAYRDKLEMKNERNKSFRKDYGQKIYRYNKQNDRENYRKYSQNYQGGDRVPNRKMTPNGENDVTFQEFMRYVSDSRNKLNEPAEEHWREIDRLCSPCTIHYDVIAKMETLQNDTHFILKRSGANELVEKLGQSTNPTNSSKNTMIQNAYAQLTSKDLTFFERRFQKDLDLFDYQRPKAITRLKSEEDDRRERVEKLRTVTVNKPGKGMNIKIGKQFENSRRPVSPKRKPGKPMVVPAVEDYIPDEENIYNYYQDRPQLDRTRVRPEISRIDENLGHVGRIRRIEDEVERHKQLMLHRIRQDALNPGLENPSSVDPSLRPRNRFRDRRLYDFGRDRFDYGMDHLDMRRQRHRRRY